MPRRGSPRHSARRAAAYMADAAEALDFLSQRHNLLHLDIKPENLLVLGRAHQGGRLRAGEGARHANAEFARLGHDADLRVARDVRRRAVGPQRSIQPGDRVSGNAGRHPALPRSHRRATGQAAHAGRAAADVAAGGRSPGSCAGAGEEADGSISVVPGVCRCAPASSEASPASVAPTELPRPIPIAPPPSAPDPDDTKPSSFCTTLRRTPERRRSNPTRRVTQPVQREARLPLRPRSNPTVAPEVFVAEETVDVAVPATISFCAASSQRFTWRSAE